MESYYTIIKILHLIGMASWFGVALAISIVLSKKDSNDHKLILDLTTKVEMPASFFIPLTGVLMMIEKTFFFAIRVDAFKNINSTICNSIHTHVKSPFNS